MLIRVQRYTCNPSKQATIVSRDIINGEPVFKVKMDSGELNIIRADQIRKVDPNDKISVEVMPDGKLDIVPVKVKDTKTPEKGSKDDNISFPEKQNSGEFSNEIVEITS